MFGKREWFRPKTIGWGLRPVRWQGWAYAAAWALVLIVPFVGLLTRLLVPEAVLWLIAAVAVLVWDVRQILGEIRADTAAGIAPTGAPRAGKSRLATRRFDLRLRD